MTRVIPLANVMADVQAQKVLIAIAHVVAKTMGKI